jgi:hypothetical protein
MSTGVQFAASLLGIVADEMASTIVLLFAPPGREGAR